MPNKHPRLRLWPEEERFLRQWMYDEVHFKDGRGPAKQLQIAHGAFPAHLAELIAASIPDPAEQLAAGLIPGPAEPLTWSWAPETLQARLAEARAVLGARRR